MGWREVLTFNSGFTTQLWDSKPQIGGESVTTDTVSIQKYGPQRTMPKFDAEILQKQNSGQKHFQWRTMAYVIWKLAL